jgi:hypothetical protein
MVETFKLIIWHDLGAAGLTDNDVSVFHQAYASGIPLYFIGERLASITATLSPPEQEQWRNLVGLVPSGRTSGTNLIELSTDSPPHRILSCHWPSMTNIVYPTELEGATIATNRVASLPPGLQTCVEPIQTASKTEVMGHSGTSDVLIFSPSQYLPDYGDVRTVSQNFRMTDADDAISLFKYSVCWLLKGPRCSSIDLNLSGEGLPEQVETGNELVYTLVLIAQGECEPDGVVVTNVLPANVCLQSVECGSGAWKHEAGVITFFLGHVKNGGEHEIRLKITVIPKVSGLITNYAVVWPNGPEVNEQNNMMRVVTEVIGGLISCPEPQAPQLYFEDSPQHWKQLIATNLLIGHRYSLEISEDLINWTVLTVFQASESRMILEQLQSQLGQRFYRLKSL